PQSGEFMLEVKNSDSELNKEWMKVTAGQGTGSGDFTVVRGQEGRAAVAHAAGSYVANVVPASVFNSFPQSTSTTLSSADILSLFTTPKEVVAAPGPGKLILPFAGVAQLHAGATPYTLVAGAYGGL